MRYPYPPGPWPGRLRLVPAELLQQGVFGRRADVGQHVVGLEDGQHDLDALVLPGKLLADLRRHGHAERAVQVLEVRGQGHVDLQALDEQVVAVAGDLGDGSRQQRLAQAERPEPLEAVVDRAFGRVEAEAAGLVQEGQPQHGRPAVDVLGVLHRARECSPGRLGHGVGDDPPADLVGGRGAGERLDPDFDGGAGGPEAEGELTQFTGGNVAAVDLADHFVAAISPPGGDSVGHALPSQPEHH